MLVAVAVIRAKRLWSFQVLSGLEEELNPTSLSDTATPELATLPSTPRALQVYTVPAGKRAIIRSITTCLETSPAGGAEPTGDYYLNLPTNPHTQVMLLRVWFVDHTTQLAVPVITHVWNGQAVLHAGEGITLAHSHAGIVHTHGSGHELNELT